MERGRYFRTRQGQAAALRRRRLRRVRVMLEQQPQSKKIKAADAIDFQRAVLKLLEAAGQSAYRGDVFLQMDFFSSAKDPPAIYRLPKNYLELLGKPRDDSGIDRTRLLYRDDRQVKALIVRYYLRERGSKPGVWVTAEPFRDFLADLDLVECVRGDDFEDDARWWRSSSTDEFREGPFNRNEYCDRDGFRELADFEPLEPQRHRTSPPRPQRPPTAPLLPTPVRSPGRQPEGGGKDLDNLATLILPAVHEVWAPPSSFAHAHSMDNIEDESIREHWENARNELPKALKHSITEYRAFALPRLPDDPEDGFVRLAVGGGMRPVRFREEIDEYLEKLGRGAGALITPAGRPDAAL